MYENGNQGYHRPLIVCAASIFAALLLVDSYVVYGQIVEKKESECRFYSGGNCNCAKLDCDPMASNCPNTGATTKSQQCEEFDHDQCFSLPLSAAKCFTDSNAAEVLCARTSYYTDMSCMVFECKVDHPIRPCLSGGGPIS